MKDYFMWIVVGVFLWQSISYIVLKLTKNNKELTTIFAISIPLIIEFIATNLCHIIGKFVYNPIKHIYLKKKYVYITFVTINDDNKYLIQANESWYCPIKLIIKLETNPAEKRHIKSEPNKSITNFPKKCEILTKRILKEKYSEWIK